MKYFAASLLNAFLWSVIVLLVFIGAGSLFGKIFQGSSHTGFFGIGVASVQSGSMEPGISEGDLVVYQKRPDSDYEPGHVIVYSAGKGDSSEKFIVHRITDLYEEYVITKGDSNIFTDEPVYYDRIIGRVVWIIPDMGKLTDFFNTPFGMAVLLGSAVILAGISILITSKSLKKGQSRESL